MRFRHSFAYLALALVTVLALAGCSAGTQASAAAATAGNAAPATAGNAAADGATYVQVQSIDGSKITAVVGTMPQGECGGQQPGASPDSAGGTEQKGSAPEQPSGDNSGSQPEGTPGQQPAGDNQQSGMGFTAGDETITFTIDDATKITAQSGPESATTDATTLTLADIAVGDILAITLSSDNVAQTIVVQQANMPSDTNSAS